MKKRRIKSLLFICASLVFFFGAGSVLLDMVREDQCDNPLENDSIF